MPKKTASPSPKLAGQIVKDGAIVRLSVEDQRLMLDAILDPPEPNKSLRKAVEAYHQLVIKSR